MDKGVNNYHKGKWGQMEKRCAEELDKGSNVDIKIEPKYSDATNRPSHFEVTETINGKTTNTAMQNQCFFNKITHLCGHTKKEKNGKGKLTILHISQVKKNTLMI